MNDSFQCLCDSERAIALHTKGCPHFSLIYNSYALANHPELNSLDAPPSYKVHWKWLRIKGQCPP